MSPEILGVLMITLMVVAIMIGFPTAFTLMSLGVTFGFLGMGFRVFDLIVFRTFFVMQNEVLVAIPLFLFMGYVIERAGILDELFHAIQVMFGTLPGSVFMGIATTDAFVHGWDLAKAIGAPEAIDTELLEAVYPYYEPLVGFLEPSGAFGPMVEAPPDADRQTKLLAMLGRRAW